MNLLGNPVRLAMLQRLAHGPLSGSDIAAELQVSLRAVSSHMHMLKCAELVKERSTGAEKRSSLSPGLATPRRVRHRIVLEPARSGGCEVTQIEFQNETIKNRREK